MITSALEFIHARKWLVELLLASALAAGVWLFCRHLVEVGVQEQKDADAVQLEKQRVADQANADKAEHNHDQELQSLRDWRDQHPFTYRVCIPAAVPKRSTADSSNAGTASSAAVGNGVSTADPDITEDRGPLLDAFAALFENENATVRQWQAQ